MKSKHFILFIIFIAFSNNAFAYFLGGINLDGVYALENSNPDGNASGYRTNLSLGYGLERYYTGIRFGLGADQFSGGSDASQGQTDIEFTLGYRFSPILSTFVGLRNRSLDFNRSKGTTLKASENINHFGLGAALSYPLRNKLIVKSDVSAYYLNTNYTNDSIKNSGSGFSLGLSGGIVRALSNGFNVNATAKLQATNTRYLTGGSYSEYLGSLSLGVARVF